MIPILDVGIVDAVRAGRVTVVAAVERFEGDTAVLADGTRLTPDAVVAGTGFGPALEPLVGHLDVLDERGRPVEATPLPARPTPETVWSWSGPRGRPPRTPSRDGRSRTGDLRDPNAVLCPR